MSGKGRIYILSLADNWLVTEDSFDRRKVFLGLKPQRKETNNTTQDEAV